MIHLLRHGHRPAWKWCYYGLTIARAEARGLAGHRFCAACEGTPK